MMNTEAVLSEFNAAREAILPALEDATEDEVLNELLLGRAQLWRGDRSAMITQLVSEPEPYVLVWIGGGDLRELLALQPVIGSWAKQHGAKAARINGRAGWTRALKHVGFAPDGEDLRKPL